MYNYRLQCKNCFKTFYKENNIKKYWTYDYDGFMDELIEEIICPFCENVNNYIVV